MTAFIRAGGNSLGFWRQVAAGATPDLDPATQGAIAHGHALLLAKARGNDAVYGVNTGFGKLASVRIPAEKLAQLQVNIVRSHQAGMGEPLEEPIVRLVLALKAASLAHGASGVQPATVALLVAMLGVRLVAGV